MFLLSRHLGWVKWQMGSFITIHLSYFGEKIFPISLFRMHNIWSRFYHCHSDVANFSEKCQITWCVSYHVYSSNIICECLESDNLLNLILITEYFAVTWYFSVYVHRFNMFQNISFWNRRTAFGFEFDKITCLFVFDVSVRLYLGKMKYMMSSVHLKKLS